LSVRLSVWSAQGNAALWLQQISVIDFEVDIVAEQKQTVTVQNRPAHNRSLKTDHSK